YPEAAPSASDQGVIGDVVSEVLTFGNAPTGTFDEAGLGKKYDSHELAMGTLYDKAVVKADENGQQIVETKEQFIAGTLGSKKDWVKGQIDSAGTAGEISTDFALSMVPIVGTVKAYRDTGSIGLTVLSAFGDIMTVVPILGAGAAAVRAGTSPIKALAIATKAEAIGTVTAPWTLLTKPGTVAKEVIGKPGEMLLKPSRLPMSSVTPQYGTLRVAIKDAGSADEALAL
ncbi:uncharacterized protein METZ01_LOCUS516910, partial [marine metagenome]